MRYLSPRIDEAIGHDTLVIDGAWLQWWMAAPRFDGLDVEVSPVILHEPDTVEVAHARGGGGASSGDACLRG